MRSKIQSLPSNEVKGPKSKIQKAHSLAFIVLLGAAGVGLLGLAAAAWTDFRGLYTQKQDYLNAVKCVQDAVGPSSSQVGARHVGARHVGARHASPLLFSFGLTLALQHYTTLNPRELFSETPSSVDEVLIKGSGIRDQGSEPFPDPRLLESAGVQGYLVLPLSNFEQQWGNTAMGHTYQHLKGQYNLVQLPCSYTSFSLFEIRNQP